MSEQASFRVALTFDAEHPDRPGCPPNATERLLGILSAAELRATFFVQGRWAESQPEVARRIADDGHLVGHHSHYHARMPLLTDDGIRADVTTARATIERVTGRDPRPWFRCPFGAGADDPRVLAVLRDLGYRNVHWNVEVEDWEPWRTGPEIAQDAIAFVRARGDGSVVLLHAWPGGTVEATPAIVTGLRAHGATFVRIDELEVLP